MASHSTYPTQLELEDYIRSLGVINPRTVDEALALMRLGQKADAIRPDWESRTAYTPFLKDVSDVTRYYDPPGPEQDGARRGGGRSLQLNAGLVTLTSLTVGYTPTAAGQVLTNGADFDLTDAGGGYNAAAEDRPYECVEFRYRQFGAPRSIKIVGKWGYSAAIPGDAWDAMLKYGAYLSFEELTLQISRGLFSRRNLNSEVRYGGGGTTPLSAEAKAWVESYAACADGYKRVGM